MATAKVEKDEYSILVAHEHEHDHDHAPFIAHHFETAEQQFDSGKLGIWIFLITEVLFFSGLFVAYTLYRYGHPDIFLAAHVHLDKFLGGINTIVLLFSSLTMAWAVRSAQLGDNKTTANCTLITMMCASAFLGVKAVEYSHKWDVGLLPGNLFSYTGAHPDHIISPYLYILSAPFALLLVGFALMSVMNLNTGAKLSGKFYGGLALTCVGYFLGLVGGLGYNQVFASEHGSDHGSDHGAHAAVSQESAMASVMATPVVYQDGQQEVKTEEAKTEEAAAEGHAEQQGAEAGEAHADAPGVKPAGDGHAPTEEAQEADAEHGEPKPVDKQLGIFFSIYYCMTGLHAIHIIGGIVALSWIYYRSLAGHWRPDYFGPVDYVGLYWHLVDLIWIYLFPLMYLIK